jgi:CheY-like chemotaxis protein
MPILVIEDEPDTRLIYEKYLRDSPFQALSVSNTRRARAALQQFQPRAIVMDIALRGEDSWNLLAELKAAETTREVPILIASAVEDRGKGFALGADAYCVKPLDRDGLLDQLRRLTHSAADRADNAAQGSDAEIVIIDDEPAARYVLSKFLHGRRCRVQEAESGLQGLRMIMASPPQLIFLDLNMPDISGFEVLERLKQDTSTQAIPVAVVTSATLSEDHRRLLEAQACAVINKTELSRQRIDDLWQEVIGP